MSAEFEAQPKPEIVVTTIADIPAVRAMQARSWNDTYPNDDAGVSREWVERETAGWLTPEAIEKSYEKLAPLLIDSHNFHRIAKVQGEPVALIHASNGPQGQWLEGLYVDKKYHGRGLAQELMAEAFQWLDLEQPITLGVIQYNTRAIKFYQKYGFILQPGTEGLLKDKIPDIDMTRPGGQL